MTKCWLPLRSGAAQLSIESLAIWIDDNESMRSKKKLWLILAVTAAVVGGFIVRPLFSPKINVLGSCRSLAVKAYSGDTNAATRLRGLGSEAVPGLVVLLNYHDSFWRREVWAIAPMLPRKIGQELLQRVGPSQAGMYRTAGARGLGLLGPFAIAAVPALLETLHDPEAYIGLEAAGALAKIGQGSVPGLINALEDKTAPVRHAAVYALGEVGPGAEAAVPKLIEKLGDADPQVRSSSAYSLAVIGYPSIAAMSNLVDHADENVRQAAVREFIRFYDSLRSMVPPLIKMTTADQASSRTRAIEALGAIRASDDATVAALIAAFKDPMPEVRLAALKALSLIPWRASVAVNALPACLKDTSPEARIWAARLLGEIGPTAHTALPELQRCLQDSDSSVRSATRDAIAKIAPTTLLEAARPNPSP